MRLDLCVYTQAEVLAGASILFAREELIQSIPDDWFISNGLELGCMQSIVDRMKELYGMPRVKWLVAYCDVDFLNDVN